jgi:hypothetical protein
MFAHNFGLSLLNKLLFKSLAKNLKSTSDPLTDADRDENLRPSASEGSWKMLSPCLWHNLHKMKQVLLMYFNYNNCRLKRVHN